MLVTQVETCLIGASQVVGHGLGKGLILNLIGRNVGLLHHHMVAVMVIGTGIQSLVVLIVQFDVAHPAGLQLGITF